MNKKGELATEQIVLLIILIASFAILLFFLVKLGLGNQTDQEICHNSVVTRGNSALPIDAMPLKCNRQYVCITVDGSCEKMTNPKIEKVKSQEDVYNYLSEDLATCWWMFGEGKINYISDEAFSHLYCSICSQIAFDDSVQQKQIFPDNQIDKDDFYKYLDSHNYSDEQTYLDYLYGKGTNYVDIKAQLESQGVDFSPIDISKQYYSMMGITSDVSTLEWAVGVGALAAATIYLLPIGAGVFSIGLLSGTVSFGVGAGTTSAVGFFVKGLSGNDYLSPSIIEVNSPEFNALGCKSITTLS